MLTSGMSAKLKSMNSMIDLVRIPSCRLRRVFTNTLIFMPFIFLLSPLSVEVQAKPKTKPASQEDVFLYRGLGASYICNARVAGVDFPKAAWIAAATYAQVLNGRHGGYVASVGKKKLTEKQLFAGAEFQTITGALQYCPKEVPIDVKNKINSAIKKENKSRKK